MRWIKSIAREVVGLFVEDGSFAGSIAAWLVVCLAALPRLAASARWAGLALFAGLAALLIESVLRFSRRR